MHRFVLLCINLYLIIGVFSTDLLWIIIVLSGFLHKILTYKIYLPLRKTRFLKIIRNHVFTKSHLPQYQRKSDQLIGCHLISCSFLILWSRICMSIISFYFTLQSRKYRQNEKDEVALLVAPLALRQRGKPVTHTRPLGSARIINPPWWLAGMYSLKNALSFIIHIAYMCALRGSVTRRDAFVASASLDYRGKPTPEFR